MYYSIRLWSRCFPLFLQENTFKIHVAMVVLNGVESRQACCKQRDGKGKRRKTERTFLMEVICSFPERNDPGSRCEHYDDGRGKGQTLRWSQVRIYTYMASRNISVSKNSVHTWAWHLFLLASFRILGRDCNAELLQRHYFSGAHEDFAISQSKDAIIYVTVSSFFQRGSRRGHFIRYCRRMSFKLQLCIGNAVAKSYLMTLHKKRLNLGGRRGDRGHSQIRPQKVSRHQQLILNLKRHQKLLLWHTT